jgi:hypothetical protein
VIAVGAARGQLLSHDRRQGHTAPHQIEALIAPLDEVSIHDLSHLEVYRTKWLAVRIVLIDPPTTPSRPEKLHDMGLETLRGIRVSGHVDDSTALGAMRPLNESWIIESR